MSSCNLKPIDSFLSWKAIEKKIDEDVKKGELSEKEAHSIIKKAKQKYKDQVYNKAIVKYA